MAGIVDLLGFLHLLGVVDLLCAERGGTSSRQMGVQIVLINRFDAVFSNRFEP